MKNLSRRSFLKSTSAAAVGAMIIPNLLSFSPNNRLNFAVIGVGGRGHANWGKVPGENIVAMCDVDDKRAARGYKSFPKAKKYKDFRKMFDEMSNQIDAVIISTPDHTHFAATMAAMQLGKHVYVEKPLAHNIWELRTLKKAAKHYESTKGSKSSCFAGRRKDTKMCPSVPSMYRPPDSIGATNKKLKV